MLWEQALACSAHPYLSKKSGSGTRHKTACGKRGSLYFLQCSNGFKLLIPIRDRMGELNSLQFIDESGEKRFVTGARKQGGYFSIGKNPAKCCALPRVLLPLPAFTKLQVMRSQWPLMPVIC